MLIHDNLYFHNVGELLSAPDGALQPIRVPQSIRGHLSEGGQRRMAMPAAMEIRWVNEDPDAPVEITLSAPDDPPAHMVIYWGELANTEIHSISTVPTTIRISPPERLLHAEARHFADLPFSTRVCRLVLHGKSTLHYHGIRGGALRPPRPDESPTRTLLTYGTSLTQGSACLLQPYSYPSQLGRNLGMDVLNLGSGGTCYCEPEMADYLGTLNFDAAVIDPCANMINQDYPVETFTERTTYMVNSVAKAQPEAPIICICLIPHYGPRGQDPKRVDAYRDSLRQIAESAPGNVTFLDGNPVINQFGNYSVDLIHPSGHGYLEISRFIQPHLETALAKAQSE